MVVPARLWRNGSPRSLLFVETEMMDDRLAMANSDSTEPRHTDAVGSTGMVTA